MRDAFGSVLWRSCHKANNFALASEWSGSECGFALALLNQLYICDCSGLMTSQSFQDAISPEERLGFCSHSSTGGTGAIMITSAH